MQHSPHITRKATAKWDAEYSSGTWDYFRDVAQAPRYVVITEWCRRSAQNPYVVDLGCGEAVLVDYLQLYGLSRYTGIDCSPVAIERARGRLAQHPGELELAVCSIQDFAAEDRPADVFVFNESLYYCDAPLNVVARYFAALNAHGLLLFSIGSTHDDLADAIEETYAASITESLEIGDRRRHKGWRLLALHKS